MLALAVLAGAASLSSALPQAARTTDPLGAAREVMQAARYCTLVTLDEIGHAQARTMDAFAPEADFTVWMATNPRSRKVSQIRKHPRVTLHYFDPASMGTVTLFGVARLVDDTAEKSRRWKEELKAFYADRDAGYLLIAVTPERLEILSPRHGIENDPVTWKPVTAELPRRQKGI
jgi:general stress protein 26